ncbi:bifunctional metallophosphatase/5'-nucleotidase, partial [Bifidobacterium animalis]|nr:bifunctional metallophosphatase/5'-nucleotidase [Bifidobacterium animalis]
GRVAGVDLGNGTSHTAVDGVLGVEGLNAHPAQAAWMSAGAEANDEVSRAQHIYQAAATYSNHAGNAVIGTL